MRQVAMDWDKVKHEYETTDIKLKELAAKYDVKPGTLRSHKSREHWQRNATKSVATQKRNVATQPENVATKKVVEKIEQADLPDKRKLFALNYLRTHNATQAYIDAYHSAYSTAMVEGSKLLRNPKVDKLLKELRKEQEGDLYLTANDVLLRYAEQAFADVRNVVEFKSVKKLRWSKVYTKKGDHIDSGGKKFKYVPWIDPQTGEQGYYYEHQLRLKDSSKIDTSNIKSIRIDKGEPVVELVDTQKALKELLDRLPEPQNMNPQQDKFLQAIIKSKLEENEGDNSSNAEK